MARNTRLIILSVLMASPAQAADVAPLPSATCKTTDDGKAVKAHEASTRLTADVLVNGRGPYKFIVDSTSDSSAVGLYIAHDLRLPLGGQAIVNGMTSRDVIDRVKVDELSVGPTTIRNLQIPPCAKRIWAAMVFWGSTRSPSSV